MPALFGPRRWTMGKNVEQMFENHAGKWAKCCTQRNFIETAALFCHSNDGQTRIHTSICVTVADHGCRTTEIFIPDCDSSAIFNWEERSRFYDISICVYIKYLECDGFCSDAKWTAITKFFVWEHPVRWEKLAWLEWSAQARTDNVVYNTFVSIRCSFMWRLHKQSFKF